MSPLVVGEFTNLLELIMEPCHNFVYLIFKGYNGDANGISKSKTFSLLHPDNSFFA